MAAASRAVVVGIDGGGTKTECWVAALDGTILGRATAAGANVLATERAALHRALRDVLARALEAADRRTADIRAAALAVAGYWRGRFAAPSPDDFRELFPPGIPIRLEPDVAAALESAVEGRPGIALIAGTGSIAFGRNAQGQTARAGGWGHLLGDEGSAYWIGLRAAHAVLRSADGRERPTSLSATIPAALGCHAPEEMVPLAYQCAGMGKREVAALAPLVVEAASEEDAVARDILCAAAAELALLVGAVAERLGLRAEAFPVVLSGGLFRAGELILRPLRAEIAARAPAAQPALAEVRPAWGAVRLALAALAP